MTENLSVREKIKNYEEKQKITTLKNLEKIADLEKGKRNEGLFP